MWPEASAFAKLGVRSEPRLRVTAWTAEVREEIHWG